MPSFWCHTEGLWAELGLVLAACPCSPLDHPALVFGPAPSSPPYPGDRVSPPRDEDVEGGVQRQRVDAREVAVVVPDHLVLLQVPALHLHHTTDAHVIENPNESGAGTVVGRV